MKIAKAFPIPLHTNFLVFNFHIPEKSLKNLLSLQKKKKQNQIIIQLFFALQKFYFGLFFNHKKEKKNWIKFTSESVRYLVKNKNIQKKI